MAITAEQVIENQGQRVTVQMDNCREPGVLMPPNGADKSGWQKAGEMLFDKEKPQAFVGILLGSNLCTELVPLPFDLWRIDLGISSIGQQYPNPNYKPAK